MDPHSEQRLIDEVIYLHSLWHQGPPVYHGSFHSRPNHSPIPNFRPPIPAYSREFFPAPESTGNIRKRKRRGDRSTNGKNKLFQSDQPPDSGMEWRCPEPVENPATVSEWPSRDRQSGRSDKNLSDEERLRLNSLQLQYDASNTCGEFFSSYADSENDEGNGESDYDEDFDENKEYEFFLNLFTKNDMLRNYYETNFDCGEFFCLVCAGVGKKNSRKRFKSCLGVLQHSIAITNTEKRRAHRAFGQVICRVLSWDYDRLPIIVFKGEPLSRLLAMSGKIKVEPERNVIDKHESGCKDDNAVLRKMLISVNGAGNDDRTNPMNNDAAVAEKTICEVGLVETKGEPERNLVVDKHESSREGDNVVLKEIEENQPEMLISVNGNEAQSNQLSIDTGLAEATIAKVPQGEPERNADVDKHESGHQDDNVVLKEIKENQQEMLISLNGDEDQTNQMNNDTGVAEATIAKDPQEQGRNANVDKHESVHRDDNVVLKEINENQAEMLISVNGNGDGDETNPVNSDTGLTEATAVKDPQESSLKEDEHGTENVDLMVESDEIKGESLQNPVHLPGFFDLQFCNEGNVDEGGNGNQVVLRHDSHLHFDFELISDGNED